MKADEVLTCFVTLSGRALHGREDDSIYQSRGRKWQAFLEDSLCWINIIMIASIFHNVQRHGNRIGT